MRPPQPSSGAKPVVPRLTWLTAFTYSIGVVSQSGLPSDLPWKARDFGISFYIDSNGARGNLDPDDYSSACLPIIPMGSTWSLHWCHSVVVGAMVRAAIDTFGLTRAEAVACIILDGQPLPELSQGHPLLAPYVDNANSVRYSESTFRHHGFTVPCGGRWRWST